MQGKIDCRENTASFWDDYRVDFDEGEEIPPDRHVVGHVLGYVAGASALPPGTTAAVVDRGDRYLIVRVTYPKLAVVPAPPGAAQERDSDPVPQLDQGPGAPTLTGPQKTFRVRIPPGVDQSDDYLIGLVVGRHCREGIPRGVFATVERSNSAAYVTFRFPAGLELAAVFAERETESSSPGPPAAEEGQHGP